MAVTAPLLETLPAAEAEELQRFSRGKMHPYSVQDLYNFGLDPAPDMMIRAERFLHQELPVRIAVMAARLRNMPGGLSEMPSIRKVHGWYVQSFFDLRRFPVPQTEEDGRRFTALIESIKQRHQRVVETVAQGIVELKEATGQDELDLDVQSFLDKFYSIRIGVRILIGQHAALRNRREGWVGIIRAETSPAKVARDAVAHAETICRQFYSDAPKVELLGNTKVTFKYIPSHLYHILLELLKNSMRAVVENHPGAKKLPPIRVIIAGGKEDISIKVSDEGGGIPRSGLNRMWSYLYSTGQLPPPSPYSDDRDAMAGYGYGLPISRLYARYFRGDLQLISMEGYGTDAYLHLNRLGDQREELT